MLNQNKLVQTGPLLVLIVAASIGANPPGNSAHDRSSSIPKPSEQLPPLPENANEANLSLREFRAFVKSQTGVVLDARSEAAYQAGHVPGARWLSSGQFELGHALLEPKLAAKKTHPIIVYCSGPYCKSADLVKQRLMELGHTRVFVFRGGWPAWQQAGLPEERSK